MSMLREYAQAIGAQAARDYLSSDEFRSDMRLWTGWAIQGFEHGFKFADRERFTATVAARIHDKARNPVMLFGRRVWRKRMDPAGCAKIAEQIVTDFLKEERIKFGDPRYHWGDGIDLADADMDYWERCA